MKSDALLAITGNLQTTIDSRETAILTGLKKGTKLSSTQTKTDLRQDIQRAGFSRRVATTLRDSQFPKRGLSFEPAALVFSKIPHILSSFADGATIRPNAMQALTIPIPGGPAENLRQKKGESIIDAFERRFGADNLVPITTKSGKKMLVARMRATRSGRFTRLRESKATKTMGPRTRLDGMVTVPVFALVKQATIKQRLKTRQIMAKAGRRHPARLAFGLREHLEQSERATAIR
ncbi:DUF6441 family protein [Litorimonas sp. WD9-15]|uniref:DUF6441 family protein n=1 Tax=Litorimonas sp. WD9-15 TaxID=3418716 RepID=UPI003D013B00